MSCLKLNKLLPTTKAWRVFTNKVQTKLQKLHTSKTIKKPKNRFQKPSKMISCLPAFCLRPRVQRKRFKPSQTHSYQSHYFQKRALAVYIDQLFIEPAVSVVKERLQPPTKAEAANKEEICPSTSSAKKPEVVDQREKRAGKKEKEENHIDNMPSADDMWESLVLSSPQMHGINERAEDFITRFRADMLLQERLARHL